MNERFYVKILCVIGLEKALPRKACFSTTRKSSNPSDMAPAKHFPRPFYDRHPWPYCWAKQTCEQLEDWGPLPPEKDPARPLDAEFLRIHVKNQACKPKFVRNSLYSHICQRLNILKVKC